MENEKGNDAGKKTKKRPDKKKRKREGGPAGIKILYTFLLNSFSVIRLDAFL
tara:strand:- start:634 stop:789 length:156 start_codon:yes stop_codon:yes gene_type:complete